ncbi:MULTISPECIES: methyl-accepting chemotaxis protein [Halomonadaceae]|uniref:Methyl-accepting chemotaxis protein II n=1 Tax=Vreelandella titanicae TaxID=664683 RepID=A0AAP9NPE2_9GAMM|nr:MULTISPECIES: methyl-accepting chemotaxis protein [Halomonas]QKS25875.1 Methyl-accepting chemotaxis protein II [Halomonas titanicae]CDG52928.1 Methyl-accepting chemotaxis citrate transducer [Halomonas sp. A3H3]SDI79063.1 methyl-accepting chemotaxis sensory transducer with Cache sensor [Halomonas titanicae]|eukprot:TRINITY_DN8089_c0_g1_i1.p1 TRINITY_DN8089_c0_g1~~TRINITY_DN8089_c0_g1_i1.p1  ORF type:complete len:610 (+),score=81.95 TRINITY_DN8089_c0_g1_i1:41-1831(+)
MSTPSAPKRALGLQTKVLMLVLLPLLLVTVVLVGFKAYSSAQDTRDTLANQREMLIEERRHAVRDIVQMATSAIEPIYEQAGANDEAAKQQVAELVRSMRFEDNNYIFIYDYDGNNIVTAPAPEREGTNMIDAQTPDGTYLIREIIKVAQSGGGFYSYMWDYPGTDRIEPKHSFVDRLEKWDWLIGAGVYVTDADDAIAELEAAAAADLRQGIIFASLLGLGLFIVIALIAYGLVRRTLGPIKRTTAAMHDIAQGRGDLTRRLAVESGDEIGELSVQFNAFVARMQNTLRDVRSSTLSVHQAAGEISQSSDELATRTEQAAANLQQTSASMEEITSTVNHSADNAQQANTLVQSTADVAREGETSMGQVESTMSDINDSASRISDIISMIDSIAFQTNILALNASVEAARAGEHGRGFAVVAQEVRVLASRSSDASKEIRALIDASVQHTNSGAKLVRSAGDTMREIVSSVAKVTDVIGEITAGAKEQSSGIGQINTAVAEMDTMTQQNAAMVQESTTAAANMRRHAEHLNQLINSFVLGEDEPTQQQALASPAPQQRGGDKGLKRPALSSQASSQPSSKPSPATAKHAADEWEEF